MNTKTNIKLLALAFVASLLFSCSSDDDFTNVEEPDPTPAQPFEEGIFILNEGGGGNMGSLSFLSTDFENLIVDAFGEVNDGEDLGMFAQSIFFDEERAFVISNGSNIISVLNRNTLELEAVIDAGLSVPMYGVVIGDKAYVSNIDSFMSTEDDYIAVIDLATLSVENSVILGDTAEFLIAHNNNLYVQNASYGTGNSISKINPSTMEVEAVLEVGEGLNSMRKQGDHLYAMTSEAIHKIDLTSFQQVESLDLGEDFSGARNLRVANGEVYFTLGTSVYAVSEDVSSLPSQPIFSYTSQSAFGSFYGFEVHSGHFYLSDAVDFASEGFIEVRSMNGEVEFTDSVGVGPNSFYFQ